MYDRDSDAADEDDGRCLWVETPAFDLDAAIGRGARIEAAAWRAAEAALAGPLAAAAAALARLDERLLVLEPERRDGARRHLALIEIAELAWAEGARLRPEALALVDRGRLGRQGHDAAVLARAAWALGRAVTPPAPLDTPEAVAARLGLRRPDEEAVGVAVSHDRPGDEAFCDLAAPLSPERTIGWLAGLDALAGTHPLTRAARAFAAWRRGDPDPGRLLEPAVLASAVALAPASPAEAPGLTVLPIALGRPPTRLRLGGPARDRLAAWLDAVEGAATAGRRRLADLDAWAARAASATANRGGRGAPALIGLFLARPVVSAPMAAEALGLTAARMRDLLGLFGHRGLVREITGHRRFRYWTARL